METGTAQLRFGCTPSAHIPLRVGRDCGGLAVGSHAPAERGGTMIETLTDMPDGVQHLGAGPNPGRHRPDLIDPW